MIAQHLAISRMRARELERPMIRATNTGATAIIDHRGQVKALALIGQRYVLSGQVSGVGRDRDAPITPYAAWDGAYGLTALGSLGKR